jgi:lipopolysaccharide export system ATP-binding protein
MMLQIQSLHKRYGDKPVVRGVSFEVSAGEIVGLLGPNGAGKTTSFYAVVGIIAPDKGQVILNGQPITKRPIHERARRGLSYLPQETSVFRKLTVAENLDLVLEFQALTASQRQERRNQLLQDFGIEKLRDKPALQLSGGERRRVEIARALACNPTYLLLDEPFTGIDPITIEDLQVLIKGLKERGIGVLMTDHNPQATLGIVDRAYVMFDGQVLFHGTAADVAESALVRQSYLGEGFSFGGATGMSAPTGHTGEGASTTL